MGDSWAEAIATTEVDERFFRPVDVNVLYGDPSKAKQRLGWVPRVTFDELVRMMVDADTERVEREIGEASA